MNGAWGSQQPVAAAFVRIPAPDRDSRILLEEKIIEPRELAYFLTRAADDKKALDPIILDVTGLASYADYFVICSGGSARQVQAIAEWLEAQAREKGIHPLSTEGQGSGKWVLMDFGSVLVHIFYEPVRGFYDLEGLWADAPRLTLEGPAGASPAQSRAASAT